MDVNGNQDSHLLVILEEDQISCCGHPGFRGGIRFHGKIGKTKWFVNEPPCAEFSGEFSVRKVLFDLCISIPPTSLNQDPEPRGKSRWPADMSR
jgi:hypothetical protein